MLKNTDLDTAIRELRSELRLLDDAIHRIERLRHTTFEQALAYLRRRKKEVDRATAALQAVNGRPSQRKRTPARTPRSAPRKARRG